MPPKKDLRDIFTSMGSGHPGRQKTASINDCLVFDLVEVRRALKPIRRLLREMRLEEHAQVCDEARAVLARHINAFRPRQKLGPGHELNGRGAEG